MSALAGYSSLGLNPISISIHSKYSYYWLDFTRKKEQQNRYNAIMSSCDGAVS